MYRVTKIISFCYGHRLLKYQGKCKFLHGHNGRAEIMLERQQLDPRGMIVDFGDVKNIVGTFIDSQLDHKMLLCERDPLAAVLKEKGEPYFMMKENPTAENIAKLIYDFAKDKKLPVKSVKLWENETCFAIYAGERK